MNVTQRSEGWENPAELIRLDEGFSVWYYWHFGLGESVLCIIEHLPGCLSSTGFWWHQSQLWRKKIPLGGGGKVTLNWELLDLPVLKRVSKPRIRIA